MASFSPELHVRQPLIIDRIPRTRRETCHLLHVLRDQGVRRAALIPPCRGKNTNGAVIPAEPVNARLDQDEAEFRVFILAASLEVLADGNGLIFVRECAMH